VGTKGVDEDVDVLVAVGFGVFVALGGGVFVAVHFGGRVNVSGALVVGLSSSVATAQLCESTANRIKKTTFILIVQCYNISQPR
jgi:hypothetical protein